MSTELDLRSMLAVDVPPGTHGGLESVDSEDMINNGLAKPAGGKWSPEEDERLRQVVREHGPKNWKVISKLAFDGARSDVQCLHRWQKVLRPGLVKGPWLQSEDNVIVHLIKTHGFGNIKWSEIAANLPGRLGKQCRERWVNHLDPDLKKTPWTVEEDRILMEQQQKLGNKWRDIAEFIPGRSENSVKNRWNSARRKRKRTETGEEDSEPGSSPSVKSERKTAKAKAPKRAAKPKKKSATAAGQAKQQRNASNEAAMKAMQNGLMSEDDMQAFHMSQYAQFNFGAPPPPPSANAVMQQHMMGGAQIHPVMNGGQDMQMHAYGLPQGFHGMQNMQNLQNLQSFVQAGQHGGPQNNFAGAQNRISPNFFNQMNFGGASGNGLAGNGSNPSPTLNDLDMLFGSGFVTGAHGVGAGGAGTGKVNLNSFLGSDGSGHKGDGTGGFNMFQNNGGMAGFGGSLSPMFLQASGMLGGDGAGFGFGFGGPALHAATASATSGSAGMARTKKGNASGGSGRNQMDMGADEAASPLDLPNKLHSPTASGFFGSDGLFDLQRLVSPQPLSSLGGQAQLNDALGIAALGGRAGASQGEAASSETKSATKILKPKAFKASATSSSKVGAEQELKEKSAPISQPSGGSDAKGKEDNANDGNEQQADSATSPAKSLSDPAHDESAVDDCEGTLLGSDDFMVVGHGLTTKHKALLRDGASAFEDKSFFKSRSGARIDHNNSEVLGISTNADDQDNFEMFTFDDLVDDLVT